MPDNIDDPTLGRTPTDKLLMDHGDRVVLEAKIQSLRDEFKASLENHVTERDKAAAVFYATRMLPLERQVSRVYAVAWFATGFAAAAFTGVVVLGVIMLWMHAS